MRSFGRGILLAVPATVLSTHARAEPSVGGRLAGILTELWGPLLFLIVALAFVAGLWLFARGLVRLKDAAIDDSRGYRGTLGEGVLHLFAASLLVALPEAAGVGVSTITGLDFNLFGSYDELAHLTRTLDIGTGASGSVNLGEFETSKVNQLLSSIGAIMEPDNCYASDDPVNCMARNVARNAVPVSILALFAFMFLYGLATFGTSIMDLAKSQTGANRLVPQGWGAKFATSVLLMNGPFVFYATSSTLLGQSVILDTGLNAASSLLSYTVGGESNDFLQRYQKLIGYTLQILAFFGVWAFVRGLLMLKMTAEGKSQTTYASGLVFMISGILLANAKASTCMVLYTAGGSGMTMGFCDSLSSL